MGGRINFKIILVFVFGFLLIGISANQFVFAEPGEDETQKNNPVSGIVGAQDLDLVEPNLNGVTFFGHGGYSADGAGVSGSGTLLAEVPPGSIVEQAYLYSSTLSYGGNTVTVNFDGTNYVLNEMTNSNYDGCCGLKAFKNSSPGLLNQVKGKIGSGSNSQFSFDFTEVSPSSSSIDGVGLVIIFSNPAYPENSIAILDGGLSVTPQQTTVGLAKPLDKNIDGFSAILSLGIGFSYPGANHECYSGQVSRVDVNGERLTTCAGGADDGFNSNGGLFTIGGVGDDLNNPPDPFGPGGFDDELYNIAGYLNQGDTQIQLTTENYSNDDIIFLAILQITAQASVGEICGDNIDNDNDGFVDEGCQVADEPQPSRACQSYDFDGEVLSEEFSGVTTTESVAGFTAEGFSGNFLRNTSVGNPAEKTTLTLTNLPDHNFVDIGFLLAIIDSWDGESEGQYSPDIMNVEVDGNSIFSKGFIGAGGVQTYEPSDGVLLLGIDQGINRAGNPGWNDSAYNMANESVFRGINHTSDTLTISWYASGSGWQGGDDESWAIDNLEVCTDSAAPQPIPVKHNGANQWDSRPTFGDSHEERGTQIVENGFSFNGKQFTITDNHWTPFEEQAIMVGTTNSFEATVYADKKLKVQEFLFGIPNVGESQLAELGVEVWYDFEGNIEDVKVVQKSDVIDADTISVSHEKVKCRAIDLEEKCDNTSVSMTFLEPLKDKVMAIKAIDYKNRDQRTYLNEGFDISGPSLNPMLTKMIPSNERDTGLIQITQVEKYSPYWISENGRMFEMNSFGSFKEVNQKFERFQDTGDARTRLHSGFSELVENEKTKATEVFDADNFISNLPDSFAYQFPKLHERIDDNMMQEMKNQENLAKWILEQMDRQNRQY